MLDGCLTGRADALGRWVFSVALLTAGAFLPAACQTDFVSLDEAKRITATFEGSSFTPPPRTINDITAILDGQKLADPKVAQKARAKASQQPPADAGLLYLVNFYWQRGLAAGRIGNLKQQLADLREAERLGAEHGGSLGLIRMDLSFALEEGGNFRDSIHYRKLAANTQPIANGKLTSLANLYSRTGDLAAAEKAILDAINITATKGPIAIANFSATWDVNTDRAEANLLDAKGKHMEAEPLYRRALRNFHLFNWDGQSHSNYQIYEDTVRIELAENLVKQGRLVEAEVVARKALLRTLGRVGRYSEDTAYILQGLIKVLNEQGRFADAEKLAAAAIDIYRKLGVQKESLSLALTRRFRGDAMAAQGRWDEAFGVFDGVRKDLSNDPKTFKRFFETNPNWILALLKNGRVDEARRTVEAAMEHYRRTAGEKHYDTAELRALLGMVLSSSGDHRAALSEFAVAASVLLARSGQTNSENTTMAAKTQRLKLVLEAYIDLLANIRGTSVETEAGVDAAAEAFRIAGVARGQSVQRALGASAARAAAKDPALADLVRREQDTQKQLGASYGLLAAMLSAPTDQQNPKTVQNLRTRIDQLRGARSALAAEIDKRFPDYAELINPKPATIDDVRAILRPGEALIATYVSEEKTYVWAIPHRGEVSFGVADMGREELADTVDWLRAALEPNATTLGDIPDFDLGVAHALYKKLLEPVKAGWRDADSLLVVAHGALGYLPLSLLPTKAAKLGPEKGALFANHRDVPWLVRTHAVTMLPSVASLKTLRGLPPGPAGRKAFVGFGDPWFSEDQAAEAQKPQAKEVAALASRGVRTRGLPVRLRAAPKTQNVDSAELARLPGLPNTADEVSSIALALNADLTTSVFLGKDASEGRIKSMDLSGFKILAFATHGLVPGDLNGLTQPALALSSPKVTGGKDDGLLTMGEILGLKLDADWVVLSACNTASGEGAGAEAVSGLGRAFFYAGTRALLVSNWPVETTSAKALTTDLFKRQAADATLTRTQALRAAMLALIDGPGYVDQASGKAVFSYAHPIFWAPFTLVGDGGGARPGA